MSLVGLPSDFARNVLLLLLCSGHVRELAAASYPHIQCGGGGIGHHEARVASKLQLTNCGSHTTSGASRTKSSGKEVKLNEKLTT